MSSLRNNIEQFAVGQVWKDREGTLLTVVSLSCGMAGYPMLCREVDDPYKFHYTELGQWSCHDTPDEYDLVELVQEVQ